ncbi:MAG: hypothetical protein IJ058_15225 [Lachnospiraceae bacterium]|nr:hypothetical protein [Lachnospiraceae bacterium]MBQ8948132.1 hypothetical protein [Lachnospiraceae bacterium]
MITYQDKVFNSWQDIVNQHPAMWVIFDKAEIKKGQVQSGNVMAILPDEEVVEFRHRNHGKIKISLRTTETVRIADENGNAIGYGSSGSMGGYIHGQLVDA